MSKSSMDMTDTYYTAKVFSFEAVRLDHPRSVFRVTGGESMSAAIVRCIANRRPEVMVDSIDFETVKKMSRMIIPSKVQLSPRLRRSGSFAVTSREGYKEKRKLFLVMDLSDFPWIDIVEHENITNEFTDSRIIELYNHYPNDTIPIIVTNSLLSELSIYLV